MTRIFLNKGFKKIPIVLRRGGGGGGHALSILKWVGPSSGSGNTPEVSTS